ncbi:MAG: RidA family protein [Planctomycetaceae bacterium]|nr:RidA family protein [Planctomycetaceae bacterium]
MRHLLSFAFFLLFTGHGLLHAEDFRIERFRNSAEQGSSQAVVVENAELVHTSQLLPINSQGVIQGTSASQQAATVLTSLDTILKKTGASKKHIVKLNIYLVADSDREVAVSSIRSWLSGADLPAISFVQTRLPNPKAKIAMDAVIASAQVNVKTDNNAARHIHLTQLGESKQHSHASILPRGDVIYVSGQAEPGDLKQATRNTLESLLKSIQQMQLDRQNIVALKCFLSPMDQVDIVNATIAEFFEGEAVPVVSHVEWIAGATRPIEIEMIASAPLLKTTQRVSYLTPGGMTASPVYSRVARIHGNQRVYISGLYATSKGTGEEQTKAIFDSLGDLLKMTGSDFQHLAKATYYVSDSDSSSHLNKLRPQFYHPKRPPAASKAMVTGVGMQNRTLSIDIIAAPVAEKSK